jgi:hypothetical protein
VVTAADGGSEQPPTFHEAQVVAVNPPAPDGQTVVDVLVPHEEAITLAAEAAAGTVTLILDSRELDEQNTTPPDNGTEPSPSPSGSPTTGEG